MHWCGWGICMEWGLALVPWLPCYRPPRKPLLNTTASVWSGQKGGRTWQWPIGSMSSSVTSPDSNFIRQMAGLGLIVYLVTASSKCARLIGSVHVWGAFHSGAKPPLVFPNRCLIGELYRGILQNNLLFERQHFGDNYRYQDNNATPHCSRLVLYFLKLGNATKME